MGKRAGSKWSWLLEKVLVGQSIRQATPCTCCKVGYDFHMNLKVQVNDVVSTESINLHIKAFAALLHRS